MKMKLALIIAFLSISCTSFVYAEEYSRYASVSRDVGGVVIEGATVSIYEAGTNDLVILYSDMIGTIKGNPFLTDVNGNYEFYVIPGLYKVVVSKIGQSTFTADNVPIGTQLHSDRHESGGEDEIVVVSGMITDGTIVSADVSASAAIPESKLSLSFPTHSNTNDPTTTQKAALAGTSGTPSGANPYVTSNDPRMTDQRVPTLHASSHEVGGGDELAVDWGQLVDVPVDFVPELHASSHQNSGADEISVAGLSGELADPQKVEVSVNGVSVGTVTSVDFVDGTGTTVSGVLDTGTVEVTVNANTDISPLATFEGLSSVVANTKKMTYSLGFDITNPAANEALVSLDLSEITVSADEFNDIPIPIGVPSNGETFVYNNISGEWEFGSSSSIDILEGGIGATTVSELDFQLGFDLSGNEISLDLSEISVDAQTLQGFTVDFDPGPASPSLVTIAGDNISFGSLDVFESGDTPASLEGLEMRFGDGFDVTHVSNDYSLIELDPTEYTDGFDATSLDGIELSMTIVTPENGDFLYYNGHRWLPAGGGTTLVVDGVATGELDFDTSFDVVTGFVSREVSLAVDGVKDTHIDWGTDSMEVDLDDVPNGTTYSKITAAQLTDLTDSGSTSLHTHSFTSLVGNYTAAQLTPGNTFSDSQVSDTLTISSAGAVNGAAIKSGTIPNARLGAAAKDTVNMTWRYPVGGTTIGNSYIQAAATINSINGIVRTVTNDSGYCRIVIVRNGSSFTSVLEMEEVFTNFTSGVFTGTSVFDAGLLSVTVNSCTPNVEEVAINVNYTYN